MIPYPKLGLRNYSPPCVIPCEDEG